MGRSGTSLRHTGRSAALHDRARYRSGRGRENGKQTHKVYTKYRGETTGMGGHVFQCHSETRERGQFEETLGALKTFASTKYVAHIDYLTPIFVNLTQPFLIKPTLDSKKETLTLKDGGTRDVDVSCQEEVEEFKIKLKEYLKDEKSVKAIKRSLYNVVWGQCSHMMRTKLNGNSNFEKIELTGDVVELLKMVRGACREMTTNASLYDAIDESKKRYYAYHQERWDGNEAHLKAFKSNTEVVEHYGGNLFGDKVLIDFEKSEDIKNGVTRSDEQVRATAREKMMGTALLKRSDMSRYGPLLVDIRDQHGFGANVYPKTLAAGHDMLEDYARSRNLLPAKKKQKNPLLKTGDADKEEIDKDDDTGVMYTQDTVVPGTNEKSHPGIKCHGCGRYGHYLSHCPDADGQKNLIVEEKSKEEKDDEENVDMGQHLQVSRMMDDASSSSSDDSYLVDFRNCQFNQMTTPSSVLTNKYSTAAKSLKRSEMKNRLNYFKDTKSILMDSGSTFSCCNNPKLLVNIRDSIKPINGVSNGGVMVTSKEGDLPGFFKVYYNPDSLMNILSLSDMRKRFRVTMDTSKEAAMLVHIAKSEVMKFIEVRAGLYVWKPEHNTNLLNKQISSYSFLSLVSENKSNFTRRELKRIDDAKKLYINMGMPGYKKFFSDLENNRIRDCELSVDDAKRCLNVYGKEIAKLKGSKTRKKSSKIKAMEMEPLPKTLVDTHSTDMISMDYLYVQGIPFHQSITTAYKFRTVEALRGKKKPTGKDVIVQSKRALNVYHARKITITQLNADNEFGVMVEEVRPMPVNVVGAGEHVGDIERSNRTVQERSRCHVHRLPFSFYPVEMVCGCLIKVTKDLNMEIAEDGVSKELSPGMLITGRVNPSYKEIMALNFGDYVQAHVPASKTNNNESRTTGCIALYPSRNGQGSWYFMSLDTGKRVHRYSWDVLPMSNDVISRVDALGKQEGQPMVASNFVFKWDQKGEDLGYDSDPEDEDNVDYDYVIPPQPRLYAVNGDHSDDESVEDNEEAEVRDNVEELGAQDNPEELNDLELQDEVLENENDGPFLIDDEQEEIVNEAIEDACVNIDAEEPNAQDVTDEPDVQDVPPTIATRSGRVVRRHDYKNMQMSQSKRDIKKNHPGVSSKGIRKIVKGTRKLPRTSSFKDLFRRLTGAMFGQISKDGKFANTGLKEGVKRHGEKSIDALLTELSQLDNMTAFTPLMSGELSKSERKMALNLLVIIREKRCGKIKGRVVADGSKQRSTVSREDAASPTIQLESLIMSLLIDAKEGRDVAISDVVGAYLLAEMKDHVLVKLTGIAVDVLCRANEKYKKFVVFEKGKKVIYLKLERALYGCIQSALLWYNTFVTKLQKDGFLLNRYDPCVANKEINGSQCTVCWYVDDTKISHLDHKVVTRVIKSLEGEFGEMTVDRGKSHKFVGMNFELLENGRLKIIMKEYLEECIESFEEIDGIITSKAPSPGAHNLFEVDEALDKLGIKRSEMFHHIVAKLLFVTKRARLDIEPTISFLCTRVTKSTEEDWLKLKRLLSYLKCTLDMPRIIGADSLSIVQSWADASYAIHPDMKGHTGGVTSFGHGLTHTECSKQKINTKSSTEAEVVGASDYLPHAIWTKNVVEAQG